MEIGGGVWMPLGPVKIVPDRPDTRNWSLRALRRLRICSSTSAGEGGGGGGGDGAGILGLLPPMFHPLYFLLFFRRLPVR